MHLASYIISFSSYLFLCFILELQAFALMPTPTSFSDCETSFQMEIMNVGSVDDKNTYISQRVVAVIHTATTIPSSCVYIRVQ